MSRGRLHPVAVLGLTKVVMAEGLKLGVQFVHQGDSRGDIEIDDVGIGHAVEHFDESAQAVAMACNQD